MKNLPLLLFLLMLLGACRSEHQRQVQMMNDLIDATDRYDTLPNDSDARAVLYYMERHGSPRELQQAWRMMAKMYRRHGALFYEGFAYEMATDCIDSLSSDFDPQALAEICYEWSINQYFSLDDGIARRLARRGMSLAHQAGDTALYYRCLGQDAYIGLLMNQDVLLLDTAHRVFDELWRRGRKDWAVDAFFPYMAYVLNYERKSFGLCAQHVSDSVFLSTLGVAPLMFADETDPISDSLEIWIQRYKQYTKQDLEHVGSYAAIEYWKLQGDYYLRKGNFDSAHYYYSKLDHPWNYVRFQGYERLLKLYNWFPERDSDYAIRVQYNENAVDHYFGFRKDRFLENEDEYRQRNVLINHELQLQHQRTLLLYGLLFLLAIAVFGVRRFYKLRREHREMLEQNREYAEMVQSLQLRDRPSLLDTDIARRFHDLSSQDAHPTAEDWRFLREEIDTLHPRLFLSLMQQYAEHQPGQTMSEQECRVISLLAIRCSPLQMSVLMVCTKSNISNLRRRLYQKLTGLDGSGSDLDKYIAEMCKK